MNITLARAVTLPISSHLGQQVCDEECCRIRTTFKQSIVALTPEARASRAISLVTHGAWFIYAGLTGHQLSAELWIQGSSPPACCAQV